MDYIDRCLNAEDELRTLKKVLADQSALDEIHNIEIKKHLVMRNRLNNKIARLEKENFIQGSIIISLRGNWDTNEDK